LLTLTLCACSAAAAAAANAWLLAVPAKESTTIIKRHPALEILTVNTQANTQVIHSFIHSLDFRGCWGQPRPFDQ